MAVHVPQFLMHTGETEWNPDAKSFQAGSSPSFLSNMWSQNLGMGAASSPATAQNALGSIAGPALNVAAKFNPYVAVGSLALGALETAIAAKKLKQLDRQKPMGYQVTPEEQELYNRSKEAAQYGFSQQQKDAYLGQMQRQSNINYERAKTMAGGSMAAALGAATSRQDMSQFALNDAQLQAAKESKFAQAAMNVSKKRDMMAQQATSEYAQKQQQWGGALKSGLSQLGSVANLMSATTYKG